MEGSFFRSQEQLALERHLERLVDEGKISVEKLDDLKQRANSSGRAASGIPTELRGRPAGEFVYQHTKEAIPSPKFPNIKSWSLGTAVSMGRSRWTADNVSIFDVQAGREMAQTTTTRQPTMFEVRRAQAIERAALTTPLVQGYRWYPEMTPGRAFFWGTVLAVAGTAIGSKVACIVLDIRQVDDIREKMDNLLHPLTAAASDFFKPIGAVMSVTGSDANVKAGNLETFAKKIKENLQSH